MFWTTVEAVCDCPSQVESWRVFIDHNQDMTLVEAKQQIRDVVQKHEDRNDSCCIETVEMKVYYEESVTVCVTGT